MAGKTCQLIVGYLKPMITIEGIGITDADIDALVERKYHSSGMTLTGIPERDLQYAISEEHFAKIADKLRAKKGILDIGFNDQGVLPIHPCYCLVVSYPIKNAVSITEEDRLWQGHFGFVPQWKGETKTMKRVLHWYDLPEYPAEKIKELSPKKLKGVEIWANEHKPATITSAFGKPRE